MDVIRASVCLALVALGPQVTAQYETDETTEVGAARAQLLAGLEVPTNGRQAPDLLAVSGADEALSLIEGDTLTPTGVGKLGPIGDLWEIARASNESIYIIDRASNDLLEVLICDGTIESVVHLDHDVVLKPRGFDTSPDGVLYGVFPGMELRTIDPKTGTTTLVTVVTGAAFLEAMAFSSSGTLYAAGAPSGRGSDTLYTLDLVTGALSLVGHMGSCDVDTLTWAADGFLYGADARGPTPTRIYRIDPETGSLLTLGLTPMLEVNGLLAIGADDSSGIGNPDKGVAAPGEEHTSSGLEGRDAGQGESSFKPLRKDRRDQEHFGRDLRGERKRRRSSTHENKERAGLARPGRRVLLEDSHPQVSSSSTDNYCVTTLNSNGVFACIGSEGLPSHSVNAFLLTANGLPPEELGVFFFGPSQVKVPFGDGFLCVGGQRTRLDAPVLFDYQGLVQCPLDLTQTPLDGFRAGDTTNFQLWYRDSQAVGTGFNLTNALKVTFRP